MRFPRFKTSDVTLPVSQSALPRGLSRTGKLPRVGCGKKGMNMDGSRFACLGFQGSTCQLQFSLSHCYPLVPVSLRDPPRL